MRRRTVLGVSAAAATVASVTGVTARASAVPAPLSSHVPGRLPAEPPSSEAIQTYLLHPGLAVETNFLGMGAQVDPYEWWTGGRVTATSGAKVPMTDADWKFILDRLSATKPGVIRCMIRAWMYVDRVKADGSIVFNFTKPEMSGVYRLLDWAQRNQVKVMFGEWDDPAGKNDRPEDNPLATSGIGVTDKRWSSMIAGLMEHLYKKRGYRCIAFYNLINEPNGSWSNNPNYDTWKTAIANLHREFVRRGIDRWLTIIGPDNAWNNDWVVNAARDMQGKVGIFDLHNYAKNDQVGGGHLEAELSSLKLAVVNYGGDDKQLLNTESGMVDGKVIGPDGTEQDSQSRRYDFEYGMVMADYVLQVMRAGCAAALAWDLDDAMHDGGGYGRLKLKGWGFFNTLGRHPETGYPASDTALRPWYWSWSFLSRTFGPGTRVLSLPSSVDPLVRVVVGLKQAARGRFHVSIAVLNNASDARTVSLRLPGARAVTARRYDYVEGSLATDRSGFPTHSGVESVTLDAGHVVTVAPHSMTVLSTAETSATLSLRLGETVIDHLEDFSRLESWTSRWEVDNGNRGYFDADPARLKRSDNSAQSVVYRQVGLRGFSFIGYHFHNGQGPGTITAETSVDGSTWTPARVASGVTFEPPFSAEQVGNWTGARQISVDVLPVGTQFLKLTLADAPDVFTPQLAHVELST